jgi:tetratricopeptide (TPR) repeat protein/TolB-like protein
LTPRPGEEYLGVGLADAVITRLSNVRELVVRPTGAVLRYASTATDPLTAGRDLRVEEILSGSIQQASDRIRVTVQLLHVEDGRPLWAETFDETPAGLFDVEDSVSSKVTEKMALRLGGTEKRQLARHYTENVEAWRNYLQGRYSEFRFTREGMGKAIEYFNHAIALDPGYAVAWAGLADAYTTASDWVLPPREALPKAEAAARKALSFDPNLAEAHGSLAHALMHEWRLAEAGAEFHRALSLNPNNTSIYFAYAEYLTALDRNDEAVTELKKALQLDPLSPAMLAMVNWPLYLKGDYLGGLEAGNTAIKVDPDFWMPYMDNGYNLLALERYPEAVAQFEKARALNPDSTINLSGLGATYARSGRRNEAMAVLAELDAMSKRQYVAPVDIANVYAALGDRDRAMDYLKRGYEEQSEMMLFLQLYGKYAGLSGDPRFQELRRRVRAGGSAR